MPPAVNRRR
ncbi:hypothetical protein MMN88_26605 [Escherichia coli]|nr:hypothetical protein [Escherichia coli]MCM4903246.1 hypothetical protein [Escherichia coli]MCM4903540.1 hypothetical protein [Escherichia coli]MCM4935576.1 hypothetical protein [Escherichia coli]MCM4935728.1 hypothetical protein [Escherichia coli]